MSGNLAYRARESHTKTLGDIGVKGFSSQRQAARLLNRDTLLAEPRMN